MNISMTIHAGRAVRGCSNAYTVYADPVCDHVTQERDMGRPAEWRLVYDPCDVPLCRGMALTWYDLRAMLVRRTTEPGAVVENSRGERWTVERGGNCGYRLARCEG